mmetsp:Transcript_23929/g.62842  ORF Transcript_23929/g.62842 Transcript_23929/m.62842 type:complete len:113 (+) Transcript_23929:1183-1521(+)
MCGVANWRYVPLRLVAEKGEARSTWCRSSIKEPTCVCVRASRFGDNVVLQQSAYSAQLCRLAGFLHGHCMSGLTTTVHCVCGMALGSLSVEAHRHQMDERRSMKEGHRTEIS